MSGRTTFSGRPDLFRQLRMTRAPRGRDSIAQGASPGDCALMAGQPQRGEIPKPGGHRCSRTNLAPMGLTHLFLITNPRLNALGYRLLPLWAHPIKTGMRQ